MRQRYLHFILLMLTVAIVVSVAGCGGGETRIINEGGPGALASTASAAGLQPYLIGFKSAPGPADEALLHSRRGAIKYNFHLIPVIAVSLPPQAVEGLSHNPRIEYIEPDPEAQATTDTVPWGITRVNADDVWPSGNVGAGVKIAIIDTGIDYTHPDLAPNYVRGHDFVNSDTDPMDDNGHGTHVAGTAAAAANETDVKGVAPGASLHALKVLNAKGSGSYSSIIAALQWCDDNNMAIASMSLGGSKGSTALRQACDAAYASGVLLVASAGNSGSPSGRNTTVGYPARYDSVIAVAATDTSDRRASWSSTGSMVGLAAPGVGVQSDKLGGGTVIFSGTSMACPHVSGVAALVIAQGTYTTAAAARARLSSTARDLGPAGRDTWYGYGLVDAAAATGTIATLAAR